MDHDEALEAIIRFLPYMLQMESGLANEQPAFRYNNIEYYL